LSITPIFLPFANVNLLDSNSNIVSGGTADWDGKYIIPIEIKEIESVKKIKVGYTCHYDTIIEFSIVNDTNTVNFFIRKVNCNESLREDCPFFSDSCDVIRILTIPEDYHPPRKVRREVKNGRLKLNRQFECCEKKWYCKTHKREY